MKTFYMIINNCLHSFHTKMYITDENLLFLITVHFGFRVFRLHLNY